ncbi:protein LOW PSII ACCUMULATION 1, chloroplastic isoform X2 [Coffea arabica]|uniref:Protein LOW PSII ACCUMULATION 1, chloroplastic isoform X2 n=1 Tax=Coffea arabica TaxID=13443 RepID=A0ABM4VPB6_COFAR
MAVVASLALHRHCPVSPASSSSSVTRVRTWIPLPNSARRPFWTRTLSESTDTTHSSSSLVCLSAPSSSSSSSSSPEVTTPPTAESCINLGLSLFSKGRVKDALSQFETALTLDPNPIEAQAAFYNKACCHAYRGEGKKAADCLRTALKEYDLKFGTILNDPDLASFRALPEFKELQEEARLGGEDIGYSFRRDLKLISEVQAPFRGVRRFFYVALTAAAGISMFFTIPRLYRSIKGGDGAPDIWETAGNAAINIGGIIVLVALFLWDNKKEEEQLAQISRDETLSRLPLRLSTNRVVELVQLRDTVRPEDFDKRAQSVVTKSKLKAEIRFKAEPVSPVEWERWIKDQQKSEGVTPGEDVYIILRLDGRVRRSGRGMPDWQQIVKELPEMDALLSKLER